MAQQREQIDAGRSAIAEEVKARTFPKRRKNLYGFQD